MSISTCPVVGASAVNVFISHAGEDSHVARQIAAVLEEHGYTTWYFERDTLPGVSYLVQCGEAIDQSDAFLLLISSHSLASHEVTREIEQAHRRNSRFLPILLDVSHPEVEKRQPQWQTVLGTAAAAELRGPDVRPLVDRLLKTLHRWDIRPYRPKGTSADGRPRGASDRRGNTRAWASDAHQIDIQDLKYIVFRNPIIDEFLEGRGKYFVSANKGLGKTLLLTYKRSLLTDAYQQRQPGDHHVCLVPEGKPYLDFMSDLPQQAATHEAFLAALANSKRLWGLALRVSALSHHPALFGEDDEDELARLPKRLAGWLRGRKVEPTVVFKEVLGATVKQMNRLIDDHLNFLEHKFRLIHGATLLFIDKVDQGIRSLSRPAWVHVQAGLIEAAWDAMSANSHVKVYASIRQEAFFNYESDIKTNLYGATTVLQYSDAELHQLLDQLTACYEGDKTFKQFVNLNSVRPGRLVEDSFQYLNRHTLRRPRDLVIIASELSRNQRALTEPGYRQLVQDTSATVLAANVFEEMRVFLDCLHDKRERLRFLALLPYNILTRREVIRISYQFNYLEAECFEVFGDSDGLFHPFWELYSAGLLGAVVPDPDGRGAWQRFKQPRDVIEDSQSALPDVQFYLIHPALNGLIRKYRPAGGYHTFQTIVVGHNAPWEKFYPALYGLEQTLFTETDPAVRALVDDVLGEITPRLHAGAGATAAAAFAASPRRAEFEEKLTRHRPDLLPLLLDGVAG